MEATANAIQLKMAPHSAAKSKLTEKYIGFILSLLSAAIIFLCGFVVRVQSMMIRWEERDMEKTNSINRVEQKVNSLELKANTLQMDVSDLKITTTRIETKQNLKPR